MQGSPWVFSGKAYKGYHVDTLNSDKHARADSVNPGQTAPKAVWSESALFTIPL